MKTPQDQKPIPAALRSFYRVYRMPAGESSGNTLLYVLVLLLIFSVLGASMVSLFTTSSTSSATPNDARGAMYMAESGMRFAMTKLRKSGFSQSTVDDLNARTYTIDSGGNFTFNVFGPWFEANQDYPAVSPLKLNAPAGKSIPVGFTPDSSSVVRVVNFDYTTWNIEYDTQTALASVVTGIAGQSGPSLDLNLNVGDDFVANANELICLAVFPAHQQIGIGEGDSLFVELAAKDIFPKRNGAINFNHVEYFYQELEVHGTTNVELTNLSALESPFQSISVDPTDPQKKYIVLSPRNYLVIPTGQSGAVSHGGDLDAAMNIYNRGTPPPGSRAPDIDAEELANNVATPASDSDFIDVDTLNDEINIGGGEAGPDFGAAWYNADKAIGGKTDFCQAGACEFGMGVRVFFTLDYSGIADGLTFALISALNNTTSSIGGDIEMGELLGYAGDSRKIVNPAAASDFVDAAGAGADPPNPGLHPPKIALEFDVYNNNSDQAYCNAGTIVDNNRNDPFFADRHQDALHFVFWGRTSLPMPCRDYTIGSTTVADHPSYDDNRHDSGDQELKWIYDTDIWNDVRSTPAVSNDGSTVYVGSDDHYLYAVNTADGTTKWWFDTGGVVRSSPVVGPDGMVYVGSHWPGGDWGSIQALNPADRLNEPNGSTFNSSNEWIFFTPNNVESSPAVGPDGTVYIGDTQGNFYALNPASRLADPGGDKNSLNPANEWEFTHADFDETSKGYPAIGPAYDIDPFGNRHRIYITGTDSNDQTLFALDPSDRLAGETFPGPHEWRFDTLDTNYFMPAADPITGVVYVEENNKIRALFPAGTSKWVASIGTNRFTPVVGNNGIVYVGGLITHDTGKVTALNAATGVVVWVFTDSGNLADVRTTPAIGPDGTIYFGSGDGLLYALNPDGSKKWTFPVAVDSDDSRGHSSPTVGDDGVIYIGSSSDNNLYAINEFAVPRNFQQNYVTSVIDGMDVTVGGEPVTLASNIDWLSGNDPAGAGPWAVRLEVMRSLSENADLKYEYTLRTWIRQCAAETCATIFGSFYEDTRIQYSAMPHLAQTIELTEAEHEDFAKFIFGFTGATGQSHSQSAVITNFKLSFIRPNDPIVIDDSGN